MRLMKDAYLCFLVGSLSIDCLSVLGNEFRYLFLKRNDSHTPKEPSRIKLLSARLNQVKLPRLRLDQQSRELRSSESAHLDISNWPGAYVIST
jgi:hypothetical protein